MLEEGWAKRGVEEVGFWIWEGRESCVPVQTKCHLCDRQQER